MGGRRRLCYTERQQAIHNPITSEYIHQKLRKLAYNRLKIIYSDLITLRRGLSVQAAKEKKIRVNNIEINYL